MTDLPKRRRGRPSKADIAAREAAARAENEAPEEVFLNEVLSRPIGERKPKLQPDEDTIRIIAELAKIGATQKEIAAVLGTSDRTLRDFFYAHEKAYQAWEDGLQHAKISLRRKQLKLAGQNAPMAIFLGKNMLGQKDEHHTNMTVSKPATEMTEQELLDIAQRGADRRKAAPAQAPAKQVH